MSRFLKQQHELSEINTISHPPGWLPSKRGMTSAGQEAEKLEPLCWECKRAQLLWKALWWALNKLNMALACGPVACRGNLHIVPVLIAASSPIVQTKVVATQVSIGG